MKNRIKIFARILASITGTLPKVYLPSLFVSDTDSLSFIFVFLVFAFCF